MIAPPLRLVRLRRLLLLALPLALLLPRWTFTAAIPHLAEASDSPRRCHAGDVADLRPIRWTTAPSHDTLFMPPAAAAAPWARTDMRVGVADELQASLPTCAVRAFTPADMASCLARRPVLFVGDSLMRYQAMELMNTLEFSAHIAWEPPSECENVRGEEQFGSWENYIAISTERLGGRLTCDCYRKEPVWYDVSIPIEGGGLLDGRGKREGHTAFRMWSNRYYRDAARSLSVSMVETLGRSPPAAAYHSLDSMGVDCDVSVTPGCAKVPPCVPGRCDHDPDKAESLPLVIRSLVQRLRPHMLFVNVGLWGIPWAAANVSDGNSAALLAALDFAASPAGGVRSIVWVTTPAKYEVQDEGWPYHSGERFIVDAFRTRGWPVFDRFTATLPLREEALADASLGTRNASFCDGVHFTRPVYRVLNELLLSLVCESG